MKKLNLDIQRFASTNKTANYNLPQFIGTDKPTWLGDINQAMFDIDAGMHTNASDIESIETIAQNASASASQASQDVAGLTSTVNTLSSNVTSVTQTANNAQQTATSALNTANTANGKADTNASNITTLNSSVSALETAVSKLGGAILWQNPTPTSTMGETTINLSSSDYDFLIWIYSYNNSASNVVIQKSSICLKGNSVMMNVVGYSTGAVNKREAIYVNDTTYTIKIGKDNDNADSTYVCIPLACIGCKLGE